MNWDECPYPSVSFSQEDILWMILDLHVERAWFHADVTYGNGCFYNGKIQRPAICSDLKTPADLRADARYLPYTSGSIRSLVFDPPFLHKSGKGSMIKERFGDFPSIPKLWKFYQEALIEFNRVLVKHGIVVFKCQDTVSCGKNWFSHVKVTEFAEEAGFRLVDLFVLLAKHRIPQWNRQNWRHARKYHCFFWVLEKVSGAGKE